MTEPPTDPDGDADLIDRLYEGGGDSELDGLRMVRGLVARVREEMPGVEPPQAVSARLLQAAERPSPNALNVAAVEPAREGLWARFRAWFGGVAMHPGMAAAATLVVVAGAAAIWMRQGGKAATPTVTTEQPASETEPAPPPELDGLADRGEPREAVTPDEVEREAVVVDEEKPTVRTPDTTKSPPRKTKPTAPAGGGDRDVDPTEVFADKGGEASGSGGGSGPTTGDTTPTVTTKVGGKKTGDAPVQAPPPPPPSEEPASPRPVTDDDEGQGAPSDAELARQLTTRAITAAKKQDCASVDALGKKVKALDPDYYASTFVKQRDIAACRAVSK